MVIFTWLMHLQIFVAKKRVAIIFQVCLCCQMCCGLTLALAMIIVTYYGLQPGEETYRRGAASLHLVVLLFITPTLFFNVKSLVDIFLSTASCCRQSLSFIFLLYVKFVFIIRIGLYLVYYPHMILINKDYQQFAQSFDFAEKYVIPATDLLLLILCLLHAGIALQARSIDRPDFFDVSTGDLKQRYKKIRNKY